VPDEGLSAETLPVLSFLLYLKLLTLLIRNLFLIIFFTLPQKVRLSFYCLLSFLLSLT
jgi:hypothetical protein